MELEPLSDQLQVYVSDNHKFSSDTVLLSNFSKPTPRQRVMELCSGCGALSLMWFDNYPPKEVVCVDIQEEACQLLDETIKHNKLQKKMRVINADAKNISEQVGSSCFNVVVCNPPYNPLETGNRPENVSRLLARHQSNCTLDDIVKSSSALLRLAGRFFMCYRPEGLCDVFETMRKYEIEPKRIRFVQSTASKPPKLVLIEGRRKANPGLLVMPTLIMKDEEGNLTEEMEQIYSPFLSSVHNKKQGYRIYGG